MSLALSLCRASHSSSTHSELLLQELKRTAPVLPAEDIAAPSLVLAPEADQKAAEKLKAAAGAHVQTQQATAAV